MAITLEQVEKLRERSGASWADCKDALERTGGDLLEAVLLLEAEGKSAAGPRSGSYTTRPGAGAPSAPGLPVQSGSAAGGRKGKKGTDWNAAFHAAWETFLNLFRHAADNHLEIWRAGQPMSSVPVVILIILIVVAFWITVPLLLIGLVLGCRYRFSGPDLGREAVNDVMDNVSDAVDDMVGQVKETVRRHTAKK